jgi:hypothetical protein
MEQSRSLAAAAALEATLRVVLAVLEQRTR